MKSDRVCAVQCEGEGGGGGRGGGEGGGGEVPNVTHSGHS